MSEGKTYIAILGFILGALLCLIGIHYLGVVRQEWIPSNFLMDALAPAAFSARKEIRISFVIVTIITALISPASDTLGDQLSRNQKLKVLTLFMLLISLYLILSIENYPFVMFAVLYPIVILVFLATAFVVANLLKFKKEKFDIKFGFNRVWEKYERPDKQSFHLFSKLEGWINIENIYRGILVIAGAGGGKSFTVIEPLIQQFFGLWPQKQKAGTGLIFDFKMNQNFSDNPKQWALGRYAYMMFLLYNKHPAKKDEKGKWIGEHSPTNDRRRFWVINFKDPRYSHRLNPIAPEYLETPGYANEYAMALLTNLEPKWNKDRDFFANSAIGYLKAIIWFLRCEYPTLCTLPHAITIALLPYAQVLAALSLNPECMEMLGSLAVADQKNADGQLAGVDASLKTPVDKINSPEIFWVLSGNNFSLRLNDKENPGVMCLGSDPELQDTYSPVCALIATVARKVMNETDRLPSMYLLDEFPQLNIPNLDALPAVSRSNDLAVVLAGQTKAQAINNYGKERADALFANLGNQLYGQLNDPAEQDQASKIIGQREKINISYTDTTPLGEGNKSTAEASSIQKDNLIHPHEFAVLETGRFIGKVAEVRLNPKTKKPQYDAFFNVKPDIERPFIAHDFPTIVKHPEDSRDITKEEMQKFMFENARHIKLECAIMIDRCARAACAAGKADEQKVFPKHFQKIGDEVVRVVSTDGKVMPGIEGIKVEGKLFTVKGRARKVETDDGMIEVQRANPGGRR